MFGFLSFFSFFDVFDFLFYFIYLFSFVFFICPRNFLNCVSFIFSYFFCCLRFFSIFVFLKVLHHIRTGQTIQSFRVYKINLATPQSRNQQ